MSQIILSHTGYKKGDSSPTFWVLTKDDIRFYRNQSSISKKELPLLKILVKDINGNNIKQESPNSYVLQLTEKQRTTSLYGDYKTLSYWLQAVNFVIQDLVETKQELDFLLSSQFEVIRPSQQPQQQQPPPQQQQPQKQERKPAPQQIKKTDIPSPSQRIPAAVQSQKKLMLEQCPTETLNQKAMRQFTCMEFLSRSLNKEVKIEELRDGKLLAELFEKLSSTTLSLKNSDEMADKIHNISSIIANTVKLCKVNLTVDPMDIIRGNEIETVKLIMGLFEAFVLGKVKVQKEEGMDGLMTWVNAMLSDTEIELNDFNETFKNGKAFALIISKRRPDLLDPKYVSDNPSINYSFVEKALSKCRCKIIPEEVYMDDADESSVIMALTSMMICLG